MSNAWTGDAMRVSDLFVQILYKTLSQRLIAELTEARVSLPQIQAMRYIWLHQNVLIGDLSEGLAISYPSATNMVNRLEKQALVERIVNPSDRREVQVRLTEQGTSLAERMEQERVARMAAVLDRMTENDRSALFRGLCGFVQAAAGDDSAVARDICLRCGSQASDACPVAAMHTLHVCR